MAFNQGDELKNRIVTEFIVDGDKKIEAALNRLQARQRQYVADVEKGAKQTQAIARVTDDWVRSIRGLERQSALDKISRDLSKATKEGEKFEATLVDVQRRLKEIGAQDDEIANVLGAAQNRAVVGGSKGAALQAFGREARLSVPAFAIPGTNLSTEFLFRVSEVMGRLGLDLKDLAIAGGAASLAIVGISLAIKNFQDTLAPVENLIRGINSAQREVAGILAADDPALIVNRQKEAMDELNRLEDERTKAIEQEARAREIVGPDTRQSAGPAEAIIEGIFGAIVGDKIVDKFAAGPLEEATAIVNDYNTKIAAQQIIVNELNKEIDAANAALEREKILKAQQALQDQLFRTQLATLNQITGDSVDAVDQRIKAIQAEQQALQEFISSGQGSAELQEDLKNRLAILGTELSTLAYRVRPAVEETQRLAEAEEYLKKQRQEMADLTEKFNMDAARLEAQSAEQRLAIQERYNQRLEDLATKAADAAEDALRKLQQKQDDLAIDLARDQSDEAANFQNEQLQLQIDRQRDEAKAARDHANAIKEINRRSQFDSLRAIESRDAIALAHAEEQKTEDIRQENERFDEARREREIAYREELQDQQAQYARERQERYLKYQRDLEDAQAQYQRELETQAIQNERSIRDLLIQTSREQALLQSKVTAQEKLLRDSYTQELRIIAMAHGERLKMEAIHQAQLLAQARRTLMGLSQAPTVFADSRVRTMAIGGNLRAGETAFVNEVRRESFTPFNERTVTLPNGRGWFTPSSDGRVNQTAGGATINLNVNGATVRTIEIISRQQSDAVWDEVMNELGVA